MGIDSLFPFQALAAINQNQPEQTFKAAAYFFQNQAQFSNANFVNQTEQDLINLFAKYASSFGVEQNTFLDSFGSASMSPLLFGFSRFFSRFFLGFFSVFSRFFLGFFSTFTNL